MTTIKPHTLDDCRELYENWQDNPFAIENGLFQEWYPKRVAFYARGGSLLDLGLGAGRVTAALNALFDSHLVIEGSHAMIELFRSKYPQCGVEVVQSMFETFDTDMRFDAVSMGFVLEHVDDPVLLLRHFRRFLKPDGRIFISVPNGKSLNRRFGYHAGLIDDYMYLSDNDVAAGHRRTYTVERLEEDLKAARLVLHKAEGLFLKPMSNEQMRVLKLSPQILEAMVQVGLDYPELCSAIFAVVEGETHD
ncbi:class I SAM-dependent methyltransferase [Desulfatiferula olefinivorans]